MSIQVRGLTKRFGAFVALDDVDVTVRSGTLTALLGPSGGGKTTLLRVIAGLEQADAGTVVIDDRDATRVPARRRDVGFVFQHYAPFGHLSVARNVAFGLEIRKRPKAEIAARVDELLHLVHLEAFADRLPSELSGGQRQRMALARALAVEPKVLLLDEPFGALDATVRKELRQWLRRLHDEVHVTTVFVTHDQAEALEVADEIVVINGGRVEQVGAPDDVYDRPANEFVMRFLGPTTSLDGRLVRPHDVEVLGAAEPGAVAAEVGSLRRVGFEARLDARVAGSGDVVEVLGSRSDPALRDLRAGDRVWLRAVGPTVAAASAPRSGTGGAPEPDPSPAADAPADVAASSGASVRGGVPA
jgi:sulfate transport system ATP-binding protein